MSLTDLPQIFLNTFVQQIAMLLLPAANGDLDAARRAATATIAAYDPKTEAELALAARIIGFSLQSIEALAQAADPEMPLTRVFRLRGGAVSLSREAQKAERQLEQLRKGREAGVPESSLAQPDPVPPRVEKATALVEDNRKVAAYAKANGLTWTKALQQRYRDQRLAERRAKEAKRTAAAPVPAVA
jgi:hypothetical protein